MLKRILTLIALILFCMITIAQNADMHKKEINRIKKNTSQYIYAEVTTTDQQTALDLTEQALLAEINKFVAENKKLSKATNIVTRNTKTKWETITMPRGNMYRAFMYVKKSDILPADNVMVTDNQPVMKPGDTQVSAQGSTVAVLENTETTKREATINRLLALQKFSELPECLKKLKAEGRVSHYDKRKNLSNPEEYVLVVYNSDGNIEAVLSEGAVRKNLKTGQTEDLQKYKGRGAFGVKVND